MANGSRRQVRGPRRHRPRGPDRRGPDLDLVARDVPLSELEAVVAKHSPAVVLLNFGTLSAPADLLALHQRLPETRILVLANRPSAARLRPAAHRSAPPAACRRRPRRATSSTPSTSPPAGCTCCRARAAAGGGVEQLGMEGSELTAARGRGARAAPGRLRPTPRSRRALDRHRDRAHARAQHLPQARHPVAARAGPAGAARSRSSWTTSGGPSRLARRRARRAAARAR